MSTMLLTRPVQPRAADALRRASAKLVDAYDDLSEAALNDPRVVSVAADVSFGIDDARRAIAAMLDPRDDG